ncbi:MAG TPA: DUF6448 family protein [Candidatus Polarisedimenticolia bacterium]|nr:DUF6448 family protein [Candidatus Polarisedimenticolia bacterium]
MRLTLVTALALGTGILIVPEVRAHCDSLDGPVVVDARLALQKGDVTPVLKWVRPDDESAIRSSFARTLAVRALGPQAKDLADQSFFETLVRIHRAGEGAPYTGLKPAGSVEPGIALADAALERGTVDALVEEIGNDAGRGIRERFARVLEAKRHQAESVSAGREYVEAYVTFIHYVEGIHRAVKGVAAAHVTDEPRNAPAHAEGSR